MAKTAKKKKKSAVKKATTKKKSARKRAAKAKSTRKTASAAKRRSTKPAKRPAAGKRAAPRKPRKKVALLPPKEFTVDPNICKVTPPSHNVAPKIFGGSVRFNATGSCTLEFRDDSVLGHKTVHLDPGPSPIYPVAVQIGRTQFWIQDCPLGTSDPSDIIVP